MTWSPSAQPLPGSEIGINVLPSIFSPRIEKWLALMPRVDTNASHPHLWDFLATLVLAPNVKVIVEAGTYRGNACLAMAEALYLHGRTARIFTADVEDHQVTEPLERMGLARYVDCYIGRFEHMLAELVSEPIDLAFVDASDANPMLRIDYVNLLMPLMRPGGLIVVDDCADDAWPGAKILRDACQVYLPLGRGTCLFQVR